jgi:hypothetical protein
MNDYTLCDKCKCFHWTNEKCFPEFKVYHPDYLGDDPKIIHAHNFDEAATKYGKYYNQDDYPLMDGSTIDIAVEKDGEFQYFRIGAEPDIYYTLGKIEPFEIKET